MTRYLFYAAILLVFHSCNDTKDVFSEMNTSPFISVKVNSDSIKTNYTYVTYLHIEDDQNKNLLKVNHDFIKGNGVISIEDSVLSLTASVDGNIKAVISVTDIYNKSSSIDLNFTSFNNLSPVSLASVNTIGKTIVIDASNSYDSDYQYGGLITDYEFEIVGIIKISKNTPVFSQPISIPGTYIIHVRVKDNNDQWSNVFNDIIAVN